jgi:Tyrosine phosphatase family
MRQCCRASRGWVELERAMRLRTIICFSALLASSCRSVVQHQSPVEPRTPDISKLHPAAGTSIVRFEQLDDSVYKGSKPKTEADYQFLQSLHIKYIVELRLFPLIHEGEKRAAKAHGMTLLFGTMNASPIEPSEAHVDQVLCLLRDQRYHPIYIHCDLGRDRAALISGLYYLYYRGVTKEQAWEHMKHFGFKDDWSLRGLKNYFDTHSDPPLDRYIPKCPSSDANSAL